MFLHRYNFPRNPPDMYGRSVTHGNKRVKHPDRRKWNKREKSSAQEEGEFMGNWFVVYVPGKHSGVKRKIYYRMQDPEMLILFCAAMGLMKRMGKRKPQSPSGRQEERGGK